VTAVLNWRLLMANKYYAVIMAGGGGTRLWPISRRSRPKQVLRLIGERSLFQIAIDRLENIFTPENILVVTVAEQAEDLQKECPQIPVENYLIEPMPRGTASVVGLASVVIKYRDHDASMAILTADHFIKNNNRFQELLITANDVANEGYLVTMGIQPEHPATGYGYIQRGEVIGEYRGHAVYKVKKFKEKPDLDQAKKNIEQGDHYWNSGMFIWRADRILEEFRKWMPQLMGILNQIETSLSNDTFDTVIPAIWHSLRPETIDYGIMEKADDVAVLPAHDLGWNDVGSWDSLFDVLSPDEYGNINVDSKHTAMDTYNTLVVSDQSTRLIVTIGVKDIVVVDTSDALLVCERKDVQKVRDLVEMMKKSGNLQYL
jgi:mannose-1-phosphate guanylyltransferase